LMGPTSHLESASESDGGAVLDGDGAIGDSTGITTPCCLTTEGITRGVPLFITGTIFIVGDSTMAGLSIIPVRPPGRSAVTTGLLEVTLNPVVKAASARAPSAASSAAERPAAFRPAVAPASEVGFTGAADFTAAVVVAGNEVKFPSAD
jgi:hypothetical protein